MDRLCRIDGLQPGLKNLPGMLPHIFDIRAHMLYSFPFYSWLEATPTSHFNQWSGILQRYQTPINASETAAR
jgi:hypothetical protein